MWNKFFGRHNETRELLKAIDENRIVLVYGPSGAGKSSLLNAGIHQSLEEEFDLHMNVRVGGALPSIARTTEIGNIFTFAAVCGLDLPANPMCRLVDCLRSLSRKPGKQGRILVLDQFEELFTQHPERHQDKIEFLLELAAALKDDENLRVIIVIRQEYLAEVELLAESLPDGLSLHKFLLKRMDAKNALEAITAPAASYARFAKDVAEEIVKHLNIITVRGLEGVPVERLGEFIEMVHLQIVCRRLWEQLEPDIKLIQMTDLEDVAGEGRRFKEFVVNALDEFYNDVVKRVADSEETRSHGNFSQEFIRFGCMQFVTATLTRTTVRWVAGRVGRLPDWIVNQLENRHLLRCEERGGERWYELAHDHLVKPVVRQRDHRVNGLLYAADQMEKALRKALDENGNTLSDYFVEHRDILRACQRFRRQIGLLQDDAEVEFIFRASLVDSLRRAHVWWCGLRDYPQMRLGVLREALDSKLPTVRRHTAALVGRAPIAELVPKLAQVVIEDEDVSVRRAAAESLAR
jgi:GTPase SAR1 family protein